MSTSSKKMKTLLGALSVGDLGLAREFIAAGEPINVQDGTSRSPLHWVIEHDDFNLAQVLVEAGADLTLRDWLDHPPLLSALHNRRSDIALLLIRAGADIKGLDRHQESALHLALANRLPKIAFALIEAGGNIQNKDSRGRTPLHLACAMNYDDLCQKLLDQGAALEASTEGGWTPLHYASLYCHPAICRLLIDRGADVKARTKRGETALHLTATIIDHKHCDHACEVGEVLLKGGVGLNDTNISLETALHRASACEYNQLADLIDWLCSRGANTELRSNLGLTPLHVAASNEALINCQRLVQAGANLEATNPYGRRPIDLVQPENTSLLEFFRSCQERILLGAEIFENAPEAIEASGLIF